MKAAGVSAVILAAGSSQRMGRPKQLLLVQGEPMLARVVDAVLASGIVQVIVVLGAAAEEIRPVLAGKPVTVVVNQDWQEGMSTSLRLGIAHVSEEAGAALFVPADMPRLSPQAIQSVVARYQEAGKAIVVPGFGGKRGNPVLFARSLFGELQGIRGDQGGRALFAAHPDQIDMVDVDDNGVLLDVDTPEEYGKVQGLGSRD